MNDRSSKSRAHGKTTLRKKLGLPDDVEPITVWSDGRVTLRGGESNNTATVIRHGVPSLTTELSRQRDQYVVLKRVGGFSIKRFREASPWAATYMTDAEIFDYLESQRGARQEAIDVFHRFLQASYSRETIERYSRRNPSGRKDTPRKSGARRGK